MKILVVSGIWPPDVGGPATHAPEVAQFLYERGHKVQVLTTAATAPAPQPYPVRWISRSIPPGVRHGEGVRAVRSGARGADVVYSTGMFGRSALGSYLARTPFVVKLTADPAYERARRWRLWSRSLGEFQDTSGAATFALRHSRDADIRRAAHIVTPSSYIRELALGWGAEPERVTVLPNPAPPVPELAPRDELRRRFGFDGPTLVFAGRLTAQKDLGLAIEAARRAGVALAIAGDGPDRQALEALGHARFLGPLERKGVLELFRAGDASILSSLWENFPHTVVEALAVGTPVIATRTGGVAEVVRDGENGLLVEPGNLAQLTAAVERFFADEALAAKLRAAAVDSVEDYSAQRIYGRLEQILIEAAS